MDLVRRISLQAALSLSYVARALDIAAGKSLTVQIVATDPTIALIELGEADLVVWRIALQTVLADTQATRIRQTDLGLDDPLISNI